jgi:hypothetical protein
LQVSVMLAIRAAEMALERWLSAARRQCPPPLSLLGLLLLSTPRSLLDLLPFVEAKDREKQRLVKGWASWVRK